MRHRSTRVLRLVGVACLLAAPETARAVDLMRPLDGGEQVPFRIVPAIDLALMGLGLSVVAGLKFTAAPPPADRAPETLWDLDAPIVTWGVHDEALWTSDLAVSAAVAAATADAAVSAGRDDVEAGAVKFTLYAQSVMTTLALTEIAKQSFQRPRPCTHQPARRLRPRLGCGPDDKDAYLSFFSGHSATAAALSATATTLSYGDDGFGARTALTLTGSLALTTFVAVERMRAGKHFPTDVLTGVLVGGAVGTLVPYLHRTPGGGDAKRTSEAATPVFSIGAAF